MIKFIWLIIVFFAGMYYHTSNLTVIKSAKYNNVNVIGFRNPTIVNCSNILSSNINRSNQQLHLKKEKKHPKEHKVNKIEIREEFAATNSKNISLLSDQKDDVESDNYEIMKLDLHTIPIKIEFTF